MSTNKRKKNNTKKDENELEKTKKYKVRNKKNTEEQKGKKKKRNKTLKKVLLGLVIFFAILAIIGVAVVIGIFSSSKYKVSREQLIIKNFNSKVVDSEGNVIAVLNGDENRKWVSIEDMPEYLPKMFVALEDERFYSHNGIDIKRTVGATVGFVFGGGSSSYGGSTITQQLIKNTFKDDEDSGIAGIQRKIREMARAYNTEKVLSKNEILELYLNKIFMGGTYYGVGTAAEYYFDKDVKDLSLAEAAYLIAINTSPNAYEPFSTEQKEIDRIKTKVKVVLAKFKDEAKGLGYELTEEAYNAAVTEVENGLAFKQGIVTTGANSYSYHTAAAISQAVEQLMEEQGLTKEAAETIIKNNGYTIYSTQISSIQEIMQTEFAKDKYIVYGKEKKDGKLINEGHTQAAMVIIEPTTGYVVGTMGGLGTDSNPTGYNRAIQGTKHPGSSLKPIGVVAPALEAGVITAATVFDDSATTFKGGYNPHNSGGYNGLLTVRHAIEHSSNIVNIKIITTLGPSKSAEFLRSINFTKLVDDDIGPSLALGATSTTPLEMAAAYAMVANDGVYIEPTFYTKVEDSDGNVILEAKQETKRAMSVENAYVLKEILTAPVTGAGGTATGCWIKGMEVGAKTGSTDDYKDRWLCGITPYYAAACWFGFDNQERPQGISGNGAARIWGEVMRSVHSGLASKRFTKPSGVVTAKICLDSGCVATESCTRTEVEYFVKGTIPGACEGHEKVKICKETGKIATEKCPEVEEKTIVKKPEKENTTLWTTKDEGKYDVPTETCDVHKVVEVEVPNVIGKKLADAKKILEDKKLKVEIVYEEDKKKDDGVVLKQSKKEKEKVTEGTTITITVNKINKPQEPEDTNTTNTETNTITNTVTNTNVVNSTTVE